MSRQERRAIESKARNLASPDEIVAKLVAEIATRGPEIRTQLMAAVPDGAVRPGHMVDALMTSAAAWERHINRNELNEAFLDVVEIMWLARAIAFSQGKIIEQPAAQA